MTATWCARPGCYGIVSSAAMCAAHYALWMGKSHKPNPNRCEEENCHAVKDGESRWCENHHSSYGDQQ
jgi:hypothetical protein